MKSTANIATTLALFSGAADAFWRMECRGRTGLARLDPLVEPGEVANHAHAIHGGSNFGLNTDYDSLVESDCTSCMVKQDKSAYWTPSLHFIHEDGETEVVGQSGGMLVYYLLPGELHRESYNVTAFPQGFRLLAGDTRQRNYTGSFPDTDPSTWDAEERSQKSLGQKAIGFNCLNYDIEGEPTAYRHFLPDKGYMDQHCKNGIRAEIYFPSCWDGKNLDSDNHKDHMAYPSDIKGGACPDDYPVQLPILLYETIWETNALSDKAGQFVFANGDPTGYGYHADFIMGWEGDNFLNDAVQTCLGGQGTIDECSTFTQNNKEYIQSLEEMEKCKFNQVQTLENDNCEGPAKGLCGNVPVQAGPEYAELLKPGNEETPTAGYTPGPSATPSMPVLSYATPQSVVNGISVYNAHEGGAQTPAVQAQEAKPTTTAIPNVPEVPAPTPEAPAPTPAPVADDSEPEGSIISTKTITSAGVIYEVAIEEVQVYVTVEPSQAPVKERRHVHHKHQRRDREHGLLGRHY